MLPDRSAEADPAVLCAVESPSSEGRSPAIHTTGLRKQFRATVALRGLSMTVERGEVFGFLGPNGAGKTTAVKLLLGLVRPTGGEAMVLGAPAGDLETRRRIGYLPELFRYQGWLSAEEVLMYHCRFLRLASPGRSSAVKEALSIVGLADRGRDRVATFSKGMQQRLGLGVALLGSPELVVLDEPTSALDPVGRHDVREIIRGMRAGGTTVFLNTHLLDEAEQVCDRIAVVDHGEAVASGTLAELLGGRATVRLRVEGLADEWWRDLPGPGTAHLDGDWVVVRDVPAACAAVPDLVRHVTEPGRRCIQRRHPRAREPGGAVPRDLEGERVSGTVTVAALTVREAVRRRLVGAFALITVGLVALSAWGFDRLSHSNALTSGEQSLSEPQALIIFMFMFSFVVALSASAMGSPAISADAESGILQTIVARPLRRSEILFGKWLGLAAVLAGYAAVVSALEFGVVKIVSGYAPPNPVVVALYLFLEGAVLLSLALALSVRLSSVAAGVIGIAVFGCAWLAGVVGSLGSAFHIPALSEVGSVARYIVPTDGLWHGAIYYLEPHWFITGSLRSIGDRGDPFFASSAPSAGYLVFFVCWFAAVLAIGAIGFERKEL